MCGENNLPIGIRDDAVFLSEEQGGEVIAREDDTVQTLVHRPLQDVIVFRGGLRGFFKHAVIVHQSTSS